MRATDAEVRAAANELAKASRAYQASKDSHQRTWQRMTDAEKALFALLRDDDD
jgi:hypothetical protein